MIKKNKILILLLAGFLMGCIKEENSLPTELPAITEEGKNTFGCLIEDEIYVPEIRRLVCCEGPSIPIEFYYPKSPDYNFEVSTFRIVNNRDDVKDAEVSMIIRNSVTKTGSYNLSYVTVKYENVYYDLDTTYNGVVMITKLDTIDKIISGQFNFQAIDKNDTNSKVIKIISGRFDLKQN